MKTLINLKKTYLINQKAQALTEFAAFGAVLLFCLALLIQNGLQNNYYQNNQMQTFRKAQKIAYYRQGPSSGVGLTVVRDKPVVDPRDRWGFADRIPLFASASVTWGSTLNSIPIETIDEEPDSRDLPQMYIEVDKSNKFLEDREINDRIDIDRVATNKKVAYTTAEFGVWRGIPSETEFAIYLEDVQPYGARGKAKDYYVIRRTARQIKVYEDQEDPDIKRAYYRDNSGLRRELVSVDLNPNRRRPQPVNIIAVEGSITPCNNDGYCGYLTGIRYIDPGAGQIDTYYTTVSPRDKDKRLENKQGLLPDYEKKMDYGKEGARLIIRNSKDEGFSTITNSDATQTITHKIRLNNVNGASELESVKVEFKPTQTYNWKVK